ncbi:hypothetical protein B0X48_02010, partial [Helicobacter pylori]
MKIAKALGLKQISNRILQDFLFDAKEKMQNPTTTPSQKSILANQLQKLQDLMPKPKLPKTNALKPLAFSYGDTRRNA